MKITTSYTNQQALYLDLAILGKLNQLPHKGYNDLRDEFFEEFKQSKPLPTMNNARYRLSRAVSENYEVQYSDNILCVDGESLVDDWGSPEELHNVDYTVPECYVGIFNLSNRISFEDEVRSKLGLEGTEASKLPEDDTGYNTKEKFILSDEETDELFGIKSEMNVEIDYGIDIEGKESEDEELLFGDESEDDEDDYDSDEDLEDVEEDSEYDEDEDDYDSEEEEDESDNEDSEDSEDEDDYDSGEDSEDEEDDDYDSDEDSEDEDDYDSEEELDNEDSEDSEDEDDYDSEEELEDEEEDEYDLGSDEDGEDFELEEEDLYSDSDFMGDIPDDEPLTYEDKDDFEVDVGFIEKQPEPVIKMVEPVKKEVSNAPREERVTPVQQEIPRDLRQFVRQNPACSVSLALQYFSKKEIESAIKIGRIVRRGDTLR